MIPSHIKIKILALRCIYAENSTQGVHAWHTGSQNIRDPVIICHKKPL